MQSKGNYSFSTSLMKVMDLRIVIKTKTTVDGERLDEISSQMDMPETSNFNISIDNGGLVMSCINEASDASSGSTIKRNTTIEIVLDRAISKKIAEACKQLPRLPQ